MSPSQLAEILAEPFRGRQTTPADPQTVPLRVVEHDDGEHRHHHASTARRIHPVSIVLWLTGPIAAAMAMFGIVEPRWLMVGVLVTVVQATNRFGLHKYGVPVWIKSVFVTCTLTAALMAAQPVISELAVAIVQGAIAGATGSS